MQLEHPELLPRKENGEVDYQVYITSPEYDFLRSNPHLGDKICLIGLGGSRAYGTDLPDSDVDIRGIALNTLDETIGLMPDYKTVVDTATDTTITSLRHAISQLIKCNPNTIELLGLESEQYLYCNDAGEEILTTKTAFLSRQAIRSFGGYATDQYDKLEHNLLRNGENDNRKLQMIKRSLENSIKSLNKMSPSHVIDMKVSVLPNTDNDLSNVAISGTFNEVPVTKLKEMISALHSIQQDYGKLNKRNTKKDEFHLNKHMMHLIRLYLMGIDLNTKGVIITRRTEDHDLLMSIRNGEYTIDNGAHVRDEFFQMLHDIQDKYMYAVEHTVLPEQYDLEAICEMVRTINAKNLFKYEDK